MLGRSSKQKRPDEASEPLLNSSQEHIASNGEDDNDEDEDVLFSVQDDDSLDDLEPATHRPNVRTVRFEDDVDVRIIAPSLRSTIQSREAGTSRQVFTFANSAS